MQIFVHGLGQTPESWQATLAQLPGEHLCVDLPRLLSGQEATYANLYRAFAAQCDGLAQPIDLCGLSLGGVLALNYAIDHPQRLRTLALIATPCQMPRRLLQFQNLLFRLMPQQAFQSTGFSKADFMRLCRTMMPLDFTKKLKCITCPTLVLCGEKDTPNRAACAQLAAHLGTELHLIPGASHEANTTAPAALATLLRSFFPVDLLRTPK